MLLTSHLGAGKWDGEQNVIAGAAKAQGRAWNDSDMPAEWVGPVLLLWSRAGAVAVLQQAGAQAPWEDPLPGQMLLVGGCLRSGRIPAETRAKVLDAIVNHQGGEEFQWLSSVHGEVILGAELALKRADPAPEEVEWVGPWQLRWEKAGPVWVDWLSGAGEATGCSLRPGDRFLYIDAHRIETDSRRAILTRLRDMQDNVYTRTSNGDRQRSCVGRGAARSSSRTY